MNFIKNTIFTATCVYLAIGFNHISYAEDGSNDDKINANNPNADITTISFHNYYIGEFTNSNDDGNQFILRFSKPINTENRLWFLRASLPVNTYPTIYGDKTGVGDLNILLTAEIDLGLEGQTFNIGPQINIPTASDDFLGTEKWSAGLVNIYFNSNSKKFQYGYLATWAHSFAGNNDRDDVNLGSLQPFLFYQLGDGHYLRSSAIVAYDFEADEYTIPVGLGYGKVWSGKNKTMYNAFIEPQYSVLESNESRFPQWQILVGFNIQFK